MGWGDCHNNHTHTKYPIQFNPLETAIESFVYDPQITTVNRVTFSSNSEALLENLEEMYIRY